MRQTGYEFDVGDRIIPVDGKYTYDVLRCYDNCYEVMENGGIGCCYCYSKEYVEQHFILVLTLKEQVHG